MDVPSRSSLLAADTHNLYIDIPSRITVQEFFTFTRYADRQYQLLNGRSMMNPAPTMRHQRIVRNLYLQLDSLARSSALGEVWFAPCDVALDRYNVIQPDLFLVSAERAQIVTERNVQGAPDLIVEVLSSPTADLDRGYKRHLYALHGVREYWLVDPDARQVEVLALGTAGYITSGVHSEGDNVTSPLLTGLALAIDDIFGA